MKVFKDTGLESPINEIALGLKASFGDRHYASGTAVVIAPHLAITAAHVITDFIEIFENFRIENGLDKIHFDSLYLQAFQITNDGIQGNLWDITKLWICGWSDLALLRLSPRNVHLDFSWKLPRIELMVPKVGEIISSFGHANPKIEKVGKEISWRVDPKTSVGTVQEIHKMKRDSVRLNFPCIRTNCRFDGAMSGGPVMNSEGHLIGLICSNLPPENDYEEHVSYVTSLWPVFGLEVDFDYHNKSIESPYPLLELANQKVITALNIDKLIFKRDNFNKIIGVGYA